MSIFNNHYAQAATATGIAGFFGSRSSGASDSDIRESNSAAAKLNSRYNKHTDKNRFWEDSVSDERELLNNTTGKYVKPVYGKNGNGYEVQNTGSNNGIIGGIAGAAVGAASMLAFSRYVKPLIPLKGA